MCHLDGHYLNYYPGTLSLRHCNKCDKDKYRIEIRLSTHKGNFILCLHGWPMKCLWSYPNSKVHGANMGPIWGRQDPDGPHVGPMNFALWVLLRNYYHIMKSISFQWVRFRVNNQIACIPVKLPWIFLQAPLKVNGLPEISRVPWQVWVWTTYIGKLGSNIKIFHVCQHLHHLYVSRGCSRGVAHLPVILKHAVLQY